MKIEPVRRFHRALSWTTGIIKDNPVLSLGMALPFAVIASTTLKSGVLMSIIMFIAIVPSVLLSGAAKNIIPRWLRLPIGCCISLLCVTAFVWHIRADYPVIVQSLGVYIPTSAFNMILIEGVTGERKGGALDAAWLAFKMCIGFALVMCSLSAIRELMVYRTLWGVEMPFARLSISGAGLPCFGFILLGFFAAFFRWAARLYMQFLLIHDKRSSEGKGENA